METVEVVIRIPKQVYEHINVWKDIVYDDYIAMVANAILNCTVLPKGHGRLIEADEVSKGKFHFECKCDCAVCSHSRNCECDLINSIPTVIEADKVESEGKE